MSFRPDRAKGPSVGLPTGDPGPPGPTSGGLCFFGTYDNNTIVNGVTTPQNILANAPLGSLTVLNEHLAVGKMFSLYLPLSYDLEAGKSISLLLKTQSGAFFTLPLAQPTDKDSITAFFTVSSLNTAGNIVFKGQIKWGSNFNPQVSDVLFTIPTGANLTLSASAAFSATGGAGNTLTVYPVSFQLFPTPVGLNV